MPKKLTTNDFVKKAQEVHGGKYDYSKVEYVSSRDKVCIICPEHGEFWQTPNKHLCGCGCFECGKIANGDSKRFSTEQFIEKARGVHGDRFDYSKVVYRDAFTPVTIICSKHGEFDQIPSSHLKGSICPKCSYEERGRSFASTTEEFIRHAKEVHGDKYDYSKAVYNKNNEKVCITCPVHGEFWQTPVAHLNGPGCPECVKDAATKSAEKKKAAHDKEVQERKEERDKNRLINGYNTFIKKAKELYGDRYDYSKVDYKNNYTPVCIVCPKHGEFWQRPSSHMEGHKCPRCSKEEYGPLYDTEEFIRKARAVHGDKYDYSKTVYNGSNELVTIICPEHGEFTKRAKNHLDGVGCPVCSKENYLNNRKYTTEDFIEKARSIHGDKYDYSKVEYVDQNTPVCIICPKHGETWQAPHVHTHGPGCPKCGKENIDNSRRKSAEQFIEEARAIHGNKYDYSRVKYINSETKVCIICPEHGEFWQTPHSHICEGHGCVQCGYKITSQSNTKTQEEFIADARKMHGDKYDYSKTVYTKDEEKVCIICPEHGEFWQIAGGHIRGNGCPKCGATLSKGENEIYEFIKSLVGEENILHQDRDTISPYELDIHIPSKHVAIEYNGIIWHSEKHGKGKEYHITKTEECKKKGIRLVQIFEDEYLDHKEIVLSYIRHVLGFDVDKPSIGARKCYVREIYSDTASTFLNKYHIQGFVVSTCYLGAYYKDKLVSVMSFKNEGKNTWNLTRYAGNSQYRLPGVASKLLSYFKKNYQYEVIKTFLDRRWNIEGDTLYEHIGFTLDKIIPPDYCYTNGRKRFHKFNLRKERMNKKYGFPLSMTEQEMASKAGLYRIWNCGLVRYIIKK